MVKRRWQIQTLEFTDRDAEASRDKTIRRDYNDVAGGTRFVEKAYDPWLRADVAEFRRLPSCDRPGFLDRLDIEDSSIETLTQYVVNRE